MTKNILLNDKQFHFSKQNLPLLIHGEDGSGASLFSISCVADLYDQGFNIIFLCGYHMARDEFELQTKSRSESVVLAKNTDADLLRGKRVVSIPSEEPELLEYALKLLGNTHNQVVFFKNFDLFDETVFSAVRNLPSLIMMGNIDSCSYATRLPDKQWMSQVYFSIPETIPNLKIPALEKYKGYLKCGETEGTVSLAQ